MTDENKVNSHQYKYTDMVSDFAVLFKGEKYDTEFDPYVTILKKIHINSAVVPVLSFNFVNTDQLQRVLQYPDNYSGIIFTSTRAVEAVCKAFLNLSTVLCDNYLKIWKNKANFSVGPATSNAARSKLNFISQGENAGNSENLCDIILNSGQTSDYPFLFPSSNIRKESVPSILGSKGLQVEEVISYETVANPDLKRHWEDVLIKSKGIPMILVFFSPSGVQFALDMLHTIYSDVTIFKYAAIGPSTKDSLEQVGIKPWIVAEKPNPESLYKAFEAEQYVNKNK